MGEIRPLRPKTGVRGRKGPEISAKGGKIDHRSWQKRLAWVNVPGKSIDQGFPKYDDKVMMDRYAFEDPADWSSGEEINSPALFIGGSNKGFRFFESRRKPEDIAMKMFVKSLKISPWLGPGEAPYWQYHHFNFYERSRYGEARPITQLQSRYAYTWRGIRREADRKHGIAGGELIVLDRITGEILGVRRSFAVLTHYRGGKVSWEFSYFCPKTLRPDGKERLVSKSGYPFTFVFQVLKPVDYDATKMRFF